ncbi:N-6 DNA methylase [bacterium]|nr:N-6 DNA methylase [bacterium]
MSKILINQYYSNLDRAVQFGKSLNEQSIRNHFWNLLNDYARKQNYEVVLEVSCRGTKGTMVRPDGIVKNLFGLDIGLWESKDEKDTIDDEIDAKQKKGYPFTNILFEDTQTAILFQRGEEVMRAPVRDADKLHSIITEFISFKSDTVHKFEDALEKFKADIPVIVETLRKRIDETRIHNKNFIAASEAFLELCRAEINPDITAADVREMMIQHILTSDIFNKIFDDPDFHRHNNIARELEKLIEILFTYSERKNLMAHIEHYYDAINSAAAGISDHHEKQKFLKVLYENFYKVYNPKAADRLGVVYTPNEIVQFMIQSAEHLLHSHFGKTLSDENVEILDPAAGTGTFITSIIDHIPKQHLAYKYNNEIHANEVAILPYYIANLNVEFMFKQKMGYYEEFKNLCFVDTLDNVDALDWARKRRDQGLQSHLFAISAENTERIKRQNKKKISVIIGNPPYNANQKNENENNKNREYPTIDKRIKETYIKHSTAQKTKVYDMYARFYRWASDRLDKNGILAFITNRSFIDSRTFDGFRKCVQDDFTACYIIDTKSDVRANPKIAGTTHNVFGIQTGVAIMFLVKKERHEDTCKIGYVAMEDNWRKETKLDWLRNRKFENISFEKISPDKNNNWINLTENDWDDLLNITKLFNLIAPGVNTARDEWVFDRNLNSLNAKMKYFISTYNQLININEKGFSNLIKWSAALKSHFLKKRFIQFNKSLSTAFLYRPYFKQYYYPEKLLSDRITSNHFKFFGVDLRFDNIVLSISGSSSNKIFSILSSKYLSGFDLLEKTQCLPLYRYTETGERVENITDWGLARFREHYKSEPRFLGLKDDQDSRRVEGAGQGGNPGTRENHENPGSDISKEDIFHYTYAVLHNPAYRKKYELNLKREFPRLPFYKDFWKWAAWGKRLMDLHIYYEDAKPYGLKVRHYENKAEAKRQKEMFAGVKEPEPLYAHQPKVKVKLKADKEAGVIEIDELTFLTGVPEEAWEYKLGNRSALEWVLDQYKEKKPKDPTIAEKFNTYRFADYKEQVIELLQKVCTVSVETMKIIEEMKKEQ